MSDTCPNCGKPVPPSALEGLCPECMLQLGAAAHTDAPGATGPHGTRVVPPPKPEEIARHFPQLEILECLGRGGMGVVYKARQPRLDRLIALKILAPEKEQQPQFAERFTREAKALARLNHPNIVTVYDFGEADGFYYLLMEYVDGMTLRQLLQRRKLAPEEALVIVPKICEALQFAHEQGVVHRDIKPENVLLDKQGRVKIADFGIAKLVAGRDDLPKPPGQSERTAGPAVPTNSLTQDQVVGTPHYMAPEQVEKPQLVDHRADIYSLGVVFYEMLTGELPLGKFQPPSKKVQVDVRLDEVVLHALEKEPERRYQHASEVKTAVEAIAAGRSAPAPTQAAGGSVRLLRWRDAWPWSWEFIQLWLIVPMAVGALALPLGLQWWGLKALWLLVPVGVSLGFAATYAIVGHRVRRKQAALPRGTGEIAQCLMFRRPFQSPGLAVLHEDRLELVPIVGSPIVIPLADIVAVKEVKWFNGTRLWLKQGFVMELANGQRVGVAVAEVFARRWRSRLSRGSLPEIPADSDSVEDRATMVARQQVRAPAVAILITIVLNYLLLVSMSASLVTGMPRLPFTLVAGAITTLVVVGAVQMWRGKAYGLAVVASILMMIIPPACILGLPLGIWALVVLRRREVRKLFGKLYPLSPPESPPRSRRGAAWKVAAVIVAAVLLVLAIPVGALLLKIVSFHKTGKRAQAIAAAQDSPPATAPAVTAGPVVEEGLYPAATQRPIKTEDLDDPSSTAQPGKVPVSRAEAGTFKLTLTNGVSVEVVAVTHDPLATKLWWKPDGTPLPRPPGARVIFQPTGMWKERDVDEAAHALLVRCGLPTGAADSHWQCGLEHTPRGERLGSLQIQQGNRMEQMAEELERLGRKLVGGTGGPKLSSQVVGYAEVVRYPAGTEEVALQCASAAGPWEPVAVYDRERTRVVVEGVRVLCTYLRQDPNGKCLDVTHDVDRGLYALRMMGVFKGGRREELVLHSGVLSGRETQGFVVLDPSQRLENIVEFVLERTPWVNGRIEGIRLKPRGPSATME